jgi:thiol-disulfide isomerase/thioredoxin
MKIQLSLIFSIILIFFFSVNSHAQITDLEEVQIESYFGNITAPDFPEGAEWFNTDKPISLKDLKGKLVLLDFWTSGCINCIHIIPDLKMLEAKYHNELVVIGVHSAKFMNERGNESIRQAILKNDLEHPVINDKDFEVWENNNVRAWPTIVLIDPKGKIIGYKSGEGVFAVFDPIISSAITEYDRTGNVLNREPVKFALEKDKITKSLLSYPGKIAADKTSSRLFITDSNNNRVLILSVNEAGNEAIVEEVIGSGKTGAKDGTYKEAEFFRPQGITYYNGKLYVADTENHLIREIDLASKQVKTIAGTGSQSQAWGYVEGDAETTPLNSPWDLLVYNDAIYIAMAGPHQLWKMDLKTGEIRTYAGSGRENLTDGDFESCALAQPSGITTDGTKLYFADAEASAIRSADLKPNGKVKTIIGTGLFDFGDIDGIGDKARIQHSLGIVFNVADGLIYIADTYNNKIKVVNPKTREVKTYSGTGLAGTRDGAGDAQFNQPEGLVIVNGKMFITDTNNNLLRVLDMSTKEVKTVVIKNPNKLMENIMADKKKKPKNIIKLDETGLKEGENLIRFNFSIPGGFKINPDAHPVIYLSSPDKLVEDSETEINTNNPVFDLPYKLNPGNGKIDIEVLIYYCETQNIGICKFKDLHFELPIKVNPAGNSTVNINYTLN